MAITIQQIAEAAGVSRGTVDRALNDRGRINPEVAKRIKDLADEMGYKPKHPKKNEKTWKIGVITQLSRTSFMKDVLRGIHDVSELLSGRGVEILLKEGSSVDEREQLRAMRELEKEGVDGIALMPVDAPAVREEMNRLTAKNIPIVTFNSDIVGTGRICFVGMDNRKSGQTAAGLMAMLTRGIGKVLVITGFFTNHGNSSRVDGFIEEMKKICPELEIAGVQSSYDDGKEVERIIHNAMLTIPGITGIFVVSGGQDGVKRAYEELKLDRRPYTILYDLTEENKTSLREDVVDFLIDQEGYVQGYEAALILADLLQKSQLPKKEYRYTDINIKTKYNI